MKNFKIIIVAIFCIPFISIKAQITESRIKYALLGGVNFQNWNGTDVNGSMMDNKLVTGYHLGGNVQIPLAPEFYFQPGFLFSTKGTKINTDSVNNKYKISYLELPLNFVYKGLLGRGFVMVGFGPYLGYGIKGKVTSTRNGSDVVSDVKFKNTIETSDPSNIPYLKSFDAGANIFAGYELENGLFFQLNTQLGALKLNPENKRISNDKTSLKNTGYGFSVGFRF